MKGKRRTSKHGKISWKGKEVFLEALYVEQLSWVIVWVCKVNWVTKRIAFANCIRRFFKDDPIVEKQMIICGNFVNWVILKCALLVAQTGFSPKLCGLWKVLTVLHSSYTEETLMKSTFENYLCALLNWKSWSSSEIFSIQKYPDKSSISSKIIFHQLLSFDASIITVFSRVHLWEDYNLSCVYLWITWDYKVCYSMVQIGWNPYTVESELNIAKGQGDPLIVKPQTTNQCIMCMSVQCVHRTQAEPENAAMSIAYLQFWHFCSFFTFMNA